MVMARPEPLFRLWRADLAGPPAKVFARLAALCPGLVEMIDVPGPDASLGDPIEGRNGSAASTRISGIRGILHGHRASALCRLWIGDDDPDEFGQTQDLGVDQKSSFPAVCGESER
jgi:hypothetical protein